MRRETTDPCVLYHSQSGILREATGLQDDDSLSLGDQLFLDKEDQEVQAFKIKTRNFLSTSATSVNGSNLWLNRGAVTMTQSDNIDLLDVPVEQNGLQKPACTRSIQRS